MRVLKSECWSESVKVSCNNEKRSGYKMREDEKRSGYKMRGNEMRSGYKIREESK